VVPFSNATYSTQMASLFCTIEWTVKNIDLYVLDQKAKCCGTLTSFQT